MKVKQFRVGTGLLLLVVLGSVGGSFLPRFPERQTSTKGAALALSTPSQDALPSLIERERFFTDSEVEGAQLSPDGRFLAFQKPLDGVINIWVKGINEPMAAARPVTASNTRPIFIYFWSADSRTILYAQDKDGNENFHLYAVEPGGGSEPIPTPRNLTPIDGIQAQIYDIPKQTPNEIIVGFNDRDPRFHDVYRLNLTTGDRTLLLQNTENIGGWTPDLNGTIRLASRVTPEKGNEILAVEQSGLTPVYTCRIEEICVPIRFHPNGQQVYLMTNRDTDLVQLELLDLTTQESQIVETDPENQVDFGGALFSEATDELIATFYVGDRRRIYPKTEDMAVDLFFLREQFPEGEITFDVRTHDDRFTLVTIHSDVNPGEVYRFDRLEQTVEKLYDAWPLVPRDELAAMQPIRYEARDGVEIPAYLTVPKGLSPENLPTVILPHGGPWGRDFWGYSILPQFLANRGYAVLQPNFRGSVGYGKAFLNAGNGQWGTGVMQHDITDGVQYLIDQGIADSNRIGMVGFSYGGYATLAGLAFTPDLYAAGVSVAGPSNIISLLEATPPYWVSQRVISALRIGDINDPSDRERLKSQSPLFVADQIQAPLMVMQGANDPRVPQAEADQMVKVLRDLGRPVEYLLAPDEGHGFIKQNNLLASTAALERFLAEHLGGRYQAELSAEIQAQLDALTVDITTVTVNPTEPETAPPLPEP